VTRQFHCRSGQLSRYFVNGGKWLHLFPLLDLRILGAHVSDEIGQFASTSCMDWIILYGFRQSKPKMWKFRAAVINLTMPAATAATAVRVSNLKEARDLLARVKFFYNGTLNRTDVAEFLLNAIMYKPEDSTSLLMTNELMKVANDGTSAILTRTFH
jgi:hypothetical protein